MPRRPSPRSAPPAPSPAFEVGNEQRFSAPRDRWAQFLELDELPRHEDWPQLFAAYRKVLRWLADPAHEGLCDYMLSSEARTLAEDVRPDLQFAGIAIDGVPRGLALPGELHPAAARARTD